MSDRLQGVMLPEDALMRFGKEDASLLHLDLPLKNATIKRYGFRLGNIGILISENTLSEVMNHFEVFSIPNTRSWFHGLTNVRGNLVPVFDLALLMGIREQPSQHRQLLVVDRGGNAIGMLIDSLPKVCDPGSWKKLSYAPQMPAGLTDFITEVYTYDDIIWLGFNHVAYFESIRDEIEQ